ncbi:hypothetical protein PSCICO_12850 [Pseudomonas cichorii]|uniref:hypothetical protein n=1 Tax=Pseudomonas cichorii TaxID=36746 RepID=UPI00191057E1|nr:hypothetical protein [Pseudomonas cichorii]GFM85886.1 hypothetical protein PSCICO_12850 [Pseudomonas cichorii]
MATPNSKIARALGLIDTAEHPLDVRFATAYATGYIDALHDAKLVAATTVQCYRDGAQTRRAPSLTEMDVGERN